MTPPPTPSPTPPPHNSHSTLPRLLSVLLAGTLTAVSLAQSNTPDELHRVALSEGELARTLRASPVPAVAADPTNRHADDPAAAHFGRWLFFDTRLSSSGGISCSTCHDPAFGFSDEKEVAIGEGVGTFNSPHIWGAGHSRWLFWDGRSETLWNQALGPIENTVEMGSARTAIVQVIARDDDLRAAYDRVFGPFPFSLEEAGALPARATPITGDPQSMSLMLWDMIEASVRESINEVFVNIGKAIAAFERTINPPVAPFDIYVQGIRERDQAKIDALSFSAQRGLKLFMGEARCHFCHSGPLFTDGEFHNTRVPPLDPDTSPHEGRHGALPKLAADGFGAASRWSDDPDGPRAAITEGLLATQELWGQFKTPSLRQVATTAPYMHQGQFPTLRRVVEHYSTFEGALPPGHHAIPDPLLEPLGLSAAQIDDLIAFLRSLEGEVGEELTGPPERPYSAKSLLDQ